MPYPIVAIIVGTVCRNFLVSSFQAERPFMKAPLPMYAACSNLGTSAVLIHFDI
jgi:hypothetical protein